MYFSTQICNLMIKKVYILNIKYRKCQRNVRALIKIFELLLLDDRLIKFSFISF